MGSRGAYHDSDFANGNATAGPSRTNGLRRDSLSRATMPGASNRLDSEPPSASSAPLTGDAAFDILDWYPAYQSCQRYFLDHAQHEPGTQALCALINIRLPFQYLNNPIASSSPSTAAPSSSNSNSNYAFTFRSGANAGPGNTTPPTNRDLHPQPPTPSTTPFISLIPYLRRLIITGFDKPPILHGFFGDDYQRGILPHLDCERRNYLFAAKHGGWRTCKKQYDEGSGAGGDEVVPFMKPLDGVRGEELAAAEKAWSGWLAMEDWMVGPRAPEDGEGGRGGDVRESGTRTRRNDD